MLMELFKAKVGIDMVHVPCKGAAAQIWDIVGGQIPVGFSSLSSALAQVHAGEVRTLAITGDVRSPLVPDAPTAAEAGVPDFEANSWYGLLAPAGAPARSSSGCAPTWRQCSPTRPCRPGWWRRALCRSPIPLRRRSRHRSSARSRCGASWWRGRG